MTTLEPLPTHPTAILPVEASTSRWLAVVSHLDPRYGGLSAAVPQLARELQHTAVTMDLAAFCAPGEDFVPPDFAAHRLTHWPTSRRAWLPGSPLRGQLREAIRQADGIHVHGLWEQSTAIACSLARSLGKPYILSAHGMLEPWALNNKRLKKRLYAALIERANVRHAACAHALTMSEAVNFRRFGRRGPIAVIPNGVTIPAAVSPEPFLAEYPVLRGKRILLFLSRLHPKKGLDLLIPAWAALAPEFPDAHLVIAGPDFEDTRAAIEVSAAAHAIADRVLFTGMLHGAMKASALAAAECFVLPSRSEGLSMSALEAMGTGLPVIVTTPCNMPEVAAIHAGWQTEPTIDGLVDAIGKMLADSPSVNAAIGARGRRLIAEQYSWPTVARQMAELYRWVQGGPLPEHVVVLHD